MPSDLIIEELYQMKEASTFARKFLLWPKMWQEFQVILDSFSWEEHPFFQSEKENIPDSPGIYTFVIKPGIANHPACAYLVYVGQTTTLKKRFRRYLDEQEGKGKPRPKLYPILNSYKNHLYFICMPLNGSVSPKEIENKLLKAYLPPCNDALPAEVRRIVKSVFV